MENIIKYVILSIILITQISCNSTSDDEYIWNLDDYISDAIEISGEPLASEYISKNNFRCYYTPDGFLGSMQLQNKKLVHLADLESGEIKVSACALGRGPGEILISSPDIDLLNNKLYSLPVILIITYI